jgi:hypothetical protein
MTELDNLHIADPPFLAFGYDQPPEGYNPFIVSNFTYTSLICSYI